MPRLIGRSEALLAACARFPYALVALHVRIQTAAAYAQLGKRAEAEALLEQALTDAAPDGLILPFAENYRYLAPLMENRPDTQAIAELGRLSEARRTRPAGPRRAYPAGAGACRPACAAPDEPRDRRAARASPRAASSSI